jgi:hypothetical protein
MPLKNIKQESFSAHWIGVDQAPGPDVSVFTCSCGATRCVNGTVIEKCPRCGHREIDLALFVDMPSQEGAYNARKEKSQNKKADQDPKAPRISDAL